MRLFSPCLLAPLWLVVMVAITSTVVQAAGPQSCCTAFSRLRAVSAMVTKGGVVRCHAQGITEGCSINAIVVKQKGRKVCVDPTPKKMRKLLASLCATRKPRNGKQNQRKNAKV
ncbi:uncharacterized protein ACJ7VT_016291 [Polymixia lowei]